ncbi:MAG: type II secretion system F family protein [Sphaerobacter sp.]|nr:type II secretion system F family protein [Sphaerobacter sp.]
MDLVTLVLILSLLSATLLIVGLATRRERAASPELEERLERFASVEAQATAQVAVTRTPNPVAQQVDRMVQGKRFSEAVALLLARANIRMTVGEFLVVRAGTATFAFALGFVLGRGVTQPILGLLVGLVMGVLGWMGPHWYVSLRARRRTNAFVNQLGDTITLMANSLRAGYSLLQTMELVARESPPPMSEEFLRVVREVGLGIPTQEAMEHLLRRVPSDDLDLLITAINVQHEVGGNLAQILDVIGETIRERVRIKGEVRVLTAQQSISGYIISALPLGLAALLVVINPGYIMGMMRWPWICMPITGVILIILGFLAMRKIVQIEV